MCFTTRTTVASEAKAVQVAGQAGACSKRSTPMTGPASKRGGKWEGVEDAANSRRRYASSGPINASEVATATAQSRALRYRRAALPSPRQASQMLTYAAPARMVAGGWAASIPASWIIGKVDRMTSTVACRLGISSGKSIAENTIWMVNICASASRSGGRGY